MKRKRKVTSKLRHLTFDEMIEEQERRSLPIVPTKEQTIVETVNEGEPASEKPIRGLSDLLEEEEESRLRDEAIHINRDELDEDKPPIGKIIREMLDNPFHEIQQKSLFTEIEAGSFEGTNLDEIEEAPLLCPVEYDTDEDGNTICVSGYRVGGVRRDKSRIMSVSHKGMVALNYPGITEDD